MFSWAQISRGCSHGPSDPADASALAYLHPRPFSSHVNSWCPLTFTLCPLTFTLCPLTFTLCPLTFILCPLTFTLCPLTFILSGLVDHADDVRAVAAYAYPYP